MLIHASCVEFNGKGILISGPSGSGKSDLALRLIEAGAILVADDIVDVAEEKQIASCPKKLEGLLEVRGIGILNFEFKRETTIFLRLNLCRSPKEVKRFLDSKEINEIDFFPFEPSAIEKIKLLLEIISSERKLIF